MSAIYLVFRINIAIFELLYKNCKLLSKCTMKNFNGKARSNL